MFIPNFQKDGAGCNLIQTYMTLREFPLFDEYLLTYIEHNLENGACILSLIYFRIQLWSDFFLAISCPVIQPDFSELEPLVLFMDDSLETCTLPFTKLGD